LIQPDVLNYGSIAMIKQREFWKIPNARITFRAKNVGLHAKP